MYSKSVLLREKINSNKLIIGIGARDALEAKLIEEANFDFVWSSSLGVSASYCIPDASLISMSQYLSAARSMNEVISIPVIADCDTGYGNINNLIYAVKLFEDSDIAGICIEDKKFPKDNSLLEGGRQELLDINEFSSKIRAAKDTQKSDSFCVIARLESFIAGWGIEDALERAYSYEKAGADLILVHSKLNVPDEIINFTNNWKGKIPIVIVPTNYYSFTEEQVQAFKKIKIVIYANQILRKSILATQVILKEIKNSKGINSVQNKISPVSEIFRLQGVPEMKAQEKKYKT